VGDTAVLEDFPQSATVAAPHGLRAMKLSRPALQAALEKFAGAMAEVRAAATRRKESIL
jgi:hypothetical protein